MCRGPSRGDRAGPPAARPPGAGAPAPVPQQPPTRPSPNSPTNCSSASASSTGCQRVVGAVGGQLRQTGVGHAADPDRGVPRQVAQVLAHLGRAGGAVEPDQVDAERLERGQRGPDLRAQQHRAGGLHGDVHDDRQVAAGVTRGPAWRPASPPWSAAGPARSRSARRRSRRPACPRPGPGRRRAARRSVTWPRVGSLVPGPTLPSTQRGRSGVLYASADSRAIRAAASASSWIRSAMPYSPSARQVGAEGVGLDRVDPDLEVGVVDRPDDVGPGDVEDLVAALELVEVVEGEVVALQHRAHRPVRDHDASGKGLTEVGGHAREDSLPGRSPRAGLITHAAAPGSQPGGARMPPAATVMRMSERRRPP